ASDLVVQIAKKHKVKTVTKSKSMVSEEMALNEALRQAGVEPVETDLGEYILQINDNEAPSHIIAPVIHKDKEEISDLFARVHDQPRLTDIPQLTREAREELRPKFLKAEMGVTGGNFVIGVIVFAILLIVNFVVITKGSGRIAEVSARFSLDAMPGKQMA
ncbi:MAG: FHIPEP family type III secretion protein, partial [bacterium]